MQKIFLPLAYGAVLACLLGSACGSGQAALAQNSVTLHKGQLPQAGWYKAPLNIQITDDRPRVSDFRTPDEVPQDIIIPIGPVKGGQPQTVGSPGVKMVRSNLTPAYGGQSNISARKPINAGALPPTTMGGHSPVDKPQPRPIGMPAGPAREMIVAAQRQQKPAAAAAYPGYQNGGGSLLSGGGGGGHKVSENVVGVLRKP